MRDLWIAKGSGRRRRGTRADELRELFQDRIQASVIHEPLKACYEDDPAEDVARLAGELDFDVLGIRPVGSEIVDGFVEAAEMRPGRSCAEFRHSFHPADLISDSTPLIEVLALLAEKQRLFVVIGNRVAGIITRADLQKPPVRLLFFGWITLLEMHLGYLVEHFYPDESWREQIKPGRLSDAESLLQQRQARNEEIGLLDCLQFCDKRDLVAAEEAAREWLGVPSKSRVMRLLREAEKLRDRVAHSQDLVVGTSWEEVLPYLLEVEKMIMHSDQQAEAGSA